LARVLPQNLTTLYLRGSHVGTAGGHVLIKALTARSRPLFLHLDRNQIESLPQECADLPDGMELTLDDNPLVTPPLDIAKQGLARIKQWFVDRRMQQRRTPDRLRVCFVGYGGAGKTTLAKLLTDGVAATCSAVNEARPMQEWSSAQVDAWIRAAPDAATAAECRFLEQLADALACNLAPDGQYLVDDVSKWDSAAVLCNTGSAFTEAVVRRWWPKLRDRIGDHKRKGYASTVGINVWELKLPASERHDGLTVEIVDLAGQMEFYTTHALFVAMRRVLYVLVSKAAAKGSASESQIEEALYWLSYLRSSMSRIRSRSADGADDVAVARVLLAMTHTDAVEPKYEPDGLLHILAQHVDKLGEAANNPPRLVRGVPCVPRYDDHVKADAARLFLIRSIEQQVRLSRRDRSRYPELENGVSPLQVADQTTFEVDVFALNVAQAIADERKAAKKAPILPTATLIEIMGPRLRAECNAKLAGSPARLQLILEDLAAPGRLARVIQDLAAVGDLIILRGMAILDAVRWCSQLLAAFINDSSQAEKTQPARATERSSRLACELAFSLTRPM
jgi:GTPase SAR1 family protein